MREIFILTIPQTDEWKRSFNVLVPLEIQGQYGELESAELPPTTYRGSIAARVRVKEKFYSIPGWAYTTILPREAAELKNGWVMI